MSDESEINNPGAIILTFLSFGLWTLVLSAIGLTKFLHFETSVAFIYAAPIALIIGIMASYSKICRRITIELILGW